MPEKFDFGTLNLSKEPDQKKFDEEFDKLSDEEKQELVDKTHVNAWEEEMHKLFDWNAHLSIDQIISGIREFQHNHNVPEGTLEMIVHAEVIHRVKQGDFEGLLRIANTFGFVMNVLKTPEARTEAIKGIGWYYMQNIGYNRTSDSEITMEERKNFSLRKSFFEISDDELRQLACEYIYSALKDFRDSAELCMNVMDEFNVLPSMLDIKKVQEYFDGGSIWQIIEKLSYAAEHGGYSDGGMLLNMIIFIDRMGLKPLMESIDLQKLRQEFESNYNVKKRNGKFDVKMLHELALNEVEYVVWTVLLNDRHPKEDIEKIKNEFSLSDDEVGKAVQNGIIDHIRHGNPDAIALIADKFALSEQEIKNRIEEEYKGCLENRKYEEAAKIKEAFDAQISKSPEIEKRARAEILRELLSGRIESAVKIQKATKIPEETLKEFTKAKLIQCLFEGKFNLANEIAESFAISPDLLASSEITETLELYYPRGITFSELLKLFKLNQIGDKLAKSLYNLEKFSFIEHIKPLLAAQGDGSFLYFEAIKRMGKFQELSSEDIDYIVYVGKRYGTQARNILDNLLNKVDSIGDERGVIEEYISEIGIAQFEIYSAYKTAKETGNQLEVDQLKERVRGLQNKIYKGEMDQESYSDGMYKAVSYYAFPAAMGLTQDQYDQLNRSRPDRRTDVPNVLESLQYQKFQVPTGKYVLEQGAELDLDEWSALSEAVKKVNTETEGGKEISIDTAEIGGKLIELYRLKKQNSDEGKKYLFESMYRYHLSRGGGKLESGYEISIDGLMKYKEFIGDRIKNDLVKDCFVEWRSKHQVEYEELKKETLNRLKQNENQNFSKVKNIVEGIRKQDDEEKKQSAIARLDDFLSDFGLSYESIKEMDPSRLQIEIGAISFEYDGEPTGNDYRSEEYYNSEAFIGAYDELLARYDQDALVIQKISSDLISGINKKMRKELDKFEFSTEGGRPEELELEFVISKKKEHGVAGYNMGVCVTPDEKLWNDSQFMNCIVFDPQTKQAMGGMHFLIRENCLCLPGINPSMDVLSQVENDKLFDTMMAYAKKVKESLGLDKILIPTDSSIHSNRQPIQEMIRKKNYKRFNLNANAEFSYNPYKYSFQECFEVA